MTVECARALPLRQGGHEHAALAPSRRRPQDRRMADNGLSDITHTIQLAVAPVFLLSALGTTLSVLTTRLSRIIDRARLLDRCKHLRVCASRA